jgi:hypothetical protein
MLGTLKGAGLGTAILSNGSPKMLSGAVESAGIGPLLDDVLSVEAVGIFKPAASSTTLWAHGFPAAGGGALRLVQRLGRGGGLRLRVPHALGEPRWANPSTTCPDGPRMRRRT